MEKNNDKEFKFVFEFTKNSERYYFKEGFDFYGYEKPKRPLKIEDFCFIKVCSVTYNEKFPRKEALENVIGAMRLYGVNFNYIIKGDKEKVSFYYGISRNLFRTDSWVEDLNIKNICDNVLKRALEGNFRGGEMKLLTEVENRDLFNSLRSFKNVATMEGVPGLNEDDSQQFQRVDRLADVMLGDEFMFLVSSMFIAPDKINDIEASVFGFYNKMSPHSKISEQEGWSESKSDQESNTLSRNGETRQVSHSKGGSRNDGEENWNRTETFSEPSKSTSESTSKSTQSSTNSSKSKEFVRKNMIEWLKYIDDVLIKRIDYGRGNGLFNVSVTLFADNDIVLDKLGNVAISLFSGVSGNKVPLRTTKLKNNEDRLLSLKGLQIPIGYFSLRKNGEKTFLNGKGISREERFARSMFSQYATEHFAFVSNWYSARELAIIAGLPCKEVVGLSLNKEVEYGLKVKEIEKGKGIALGYLVQSQVVHKNISVTIGKEDMNKHVFVCGVTGSGKTTTCMRLLLESGYPFLVIEPAKTEYRVLANNHDCLVFTLGDNVAPFRLNPLEFLEGESISAHVDMVKACIEAAFDMEAAIPQIIESSLYRCYEKIGWNVETNKNSKYENPYADDVNAFPTLSDFIEVTKEIVEEQGFDERLKNDYLGSVRARLKGLVVGAKGSMLNTPRSIDFFKLLDRNVVIELENIKSGSEKSLIMGFILANLNEAQKIVFKKNGNKKKNHITLVEEAHRLLSKYSPGDSLNKKNGVETFSDMLAEVRKYGECLIIADQIPEKMTPEVLKNTNTKIVHKIFAQDDKESIGNTMDLSDEQKSYLSNLQTGRAVVFSQDWDKSILVQIEKLIDTTNEKIEDEKLRNKALEYYLECYDRVRLTKYKLKEIPDVEKYNHMVDNEDVIDAFCNLYRKVQNGDFSILNDLKGIIKRLGLFLSINDMSIIINDKLYSMSKPESNIANLIIAIERGRDEKELLADFSDLIFNDGYLGELLKKVKNMGALATNKDIKEYIFKLREIEVEQLAESLNKHVDGGNSQTKEVLKKYTEGVLNRENSEKLYEYLKDCKSKNLI
jgi:hypothetical protein